MHIHKFLILVICIINACVDILECPGQPQGVSFTWETTVLGTFGADSHIYDTCILNSNLAYGVGYFTQPDSLDNSTPSIYNVAIWDGTQWTPDRFSEAYFSPEGIVDSTIGGQLEGIISVDNSGLWFNETSNSLTYYNGIDYEFYAVPDLPPGCRRMAYSLFAISNSEIYIGNGLGEVYLFDGVTISHYIDIPTDNAIIKIVGDASNIYILSNMPCIPELPTYHISRLNSGTLSTIYHCDVAQPGPASSQLGVLLSMWLYDQLLYVVFSSGMYVYNPDDESMTSLFTAEEMGTEYVYIVDMDGNSPNDILLLGNHAEIFHYNGKTWSSDLSMSNTGKYIIESHMEFDYHGDMVVFGGNYLQNGWHRAAITVGRRND